MKKLSLRFAYFFLIFFSFSFPKIVFARGFKEDAFDAEQEVKNCERVSSWLFPTSKIKVTKHTQDDNLKRMALVTSTLLLHVLVAPAAVEWMLRKNEKESIEPEETKEIQRNVHKQKVVSRKVKPGIKKRVRRKKRAEQKNIDIAPGKEEKSGNATSSNEKKQSKKVKEFKKLFEQMVPFDSQKRLLATGVTSGGQESILYLAGHTDIKSGLANVGHNTVITLSQEVVTNFLCDQLGCKQNGSSAHFIRAVARLTICYGTWAIRGFLQGYC